MRFLSTLIVGTTFIAVAIFALSCNKNSLNGDTSGAKDTWAVIQENIITPSCATSGCHSSTSDGTYKQHELVLSPGVAYDNLVNKTAANAAAKTDGLLRVKAGEYHHSLLYEKINCQGYQSKYGALMPLGGPNLTVGQIEFIKQWIAKGAPRTGSVVDENILKNNTVCSETFTPMPAPAPAEGFQLSINPFNINPNTEREVFVNRKAPNTSTVYINKFVMQGRRNSHHFVLYGFQNTAALPPVNVMRDLYNADGSLNMVTFSQMQNHLFLSGGTDVGGTYTFPPGVALKLPAGTHLDLNAHYFNKQNISLTGENYINLYMVPQSSVVKEAQSINFGNYNFSIPANSRKTITTDFTFSKPVTVITLTSHYHKMGEKFQIKILGGARNGEVVYESTDWEHPLVVNLTAPIQLKAGEGLTSVVTYNNTSSKTINFGLTSEDEMNIIFGYYY
jgi:hypothetical protein